MYHIGKYDKDSSEFVSSKSKGHSNGYLESGNTLKRFGGEGKYRLSFYRTV